MVRGSQPARVQSCLHLVLLPDPWHVAESQLLASSLLKGGMRRDLPAQQLRAQTVPARMGRCGVVFPRCPSTGAGCNGWQASLCAGPQCHEGRSCSHRARELHWQRQHMRLCCRTLPCVSGLVIKQKIFNGSVFMKVI